MTYSVDLYVDFLIASQKQYSGLELSKVAPDEMAHDAVSRWLSSHKLTPKILWQHASPMVNLHTGYLIVDDTLLDKPYSRITSLVKYQYSGKYHRTVNGIGLVTMLWTDGERVIPVDYRAYDPTRDGKTKNDHAQEMLDFAERRGFSPVYVLLDSWYSSITNLKSISRKGWRWIAERKANRLVSLVQGTYLHVSDLDWTATPVHKVWLKAYGFVLVSEIVLEKGTSPISPRTIGLSVMRRQSKAITSTAGILKPSTGESNNAVGLNAVIPRWNDRNGIISYAPSWHS